MHETASPTPSTPASRWRALIALAAEAAPALADLARTSSLPAPVQMTRRGIARPCPVCGHRIVLALRPHCEERPLKPAAPQLPRQPRFADLWPVERPHTDAARVYPILQFAVALVAAVALTGCAALPVDAVEYRTDGGDDHQVRIEFALPTQQPCPKRGGLAK